MTLAPFVRTSETSRLAAVSVHHTKEQQATVVLRAIRQFQPVTDEGIAEVTGLAGNSVRPRRGELVAAGLVRESGERGRTRAGRSATQWEAVPEQLGLGL